MAQYCDMFARPWHHPRPGFTETSKPPARCSTAPKRSESSRGLRCPASSSPSATSRCTARGPFFAFFLPVRRIPLLPHLPDSLPPLARTNFRRKPRKERERERETDAQSFLQDLPPTRAIQPVSRPREEGVGRSRLRYWRKGRREKQKGVGPSLSV